MHCVHVHVGFGGKGGGVGEKAGNPSQLLGSKRYRLWLSNLPVTAGGKKCIMKYCTGGAA